MYEIYVRKKIEQGIRAADKGNVISHEEVKKRFGMKPRGFFMTFEGIEGSGKTTQIKKLAAALRKMKYSVAVTQEPGGTHMGQAIRKLLLDSKKHTLLPESEALLFLADRIHHVREIILPALRKRQIVLCDRFSDSTMAYQGFGRGLSVKLLTEMNHWVTGGLIPDFTVVLDLEPAEGLARLQKRKQTNRMDKEKIQFYQRVRKGYAALARRNSRMKIVNASQEAQALHTEILRIVKAVLS